MRGERRAVAAAAVPATAAPDRHAMRIGLAAPLRISYTY